MPRIDVRDHAGVPTLHIDGRPEFFASLWVWPPKGPKPWRGAQEIRWFSEAGVRIHNWFQPWEEPEDYESGSYSFSVLSSFVEQILEADPEALLAIKQNVDAPEWWQERFPEECEQLRVPDGLSTPRRLQSYASTRWRRDSRLYLRAMIDFIRAQTWSNHVIAVLPCGGGAGEWMTGSPCYSFDHSAPMQRHFRDRLADKYGSDAALRDAWQSETVSLEDAPVPSRQQFLAADDWDFRDPRLARPVLDFIDCMDMLVSDCVIDLCRTVRETAGESLLTGTYFDKSAESWWPLGFWTPGPEAPRRVPMMLASGNAALLRVLRSPSVQALASPYSYVHRAVGGDAGYMQLVESAHRHGKLVIFEDDARHSVSPIPPGEFGRPATPGETLTQITRNFGHILARGTGMWWGYPWNRSAEESDWHQPQVMNRVRRLTQLGRFDVARGGARGSSAQIALVVDPAADNYLRPDFRRGWDSIVRMRAWELPRLGAPCDAWHIDDLVAGRMRPYRLVIFPNLYAASPDRIRAICDYLDRHEAAALWVYAAGYVSLAPGAEQLSLENMQRLTGIRFARHDVEWTATVTVTAYDHPITRDLPAHVTYGWRSTAGPVFAADDPDAHVLGNVVHFMGKCEPGLVVKRIRNRCSVWSAVPGLPACLLRAIAREAGVHIWSDADDVLYANDTWLCVHTLKPGLRTFHLPRTTAVHEALTGALVAESCDHFTADLPGRSTTLYHLGPTLPAP